jgi:hypothetical protein
MYSFADEEHVSDPTGKFLAPTERQAKELKLLFDDNYLKTSSYITINGKDFEIDLDENNKELSKKQIKSEVKIESKFIHKNEADLIKKGKRQS